MIEDLKSIAIFVETIKRGSFRGAAKSLSLSPSTVSYNVAELEKKLGTSLIYRTTRKLSLTTQGERLFQYGVKMVAAGERGINEVTPDSGELRGNLRLSITSALVKSDLNVLISNFSKQHPDISFDIVYTDTQENLVANGIDLAFRAGTLVDSTLKSKRIGKIERVLVCSAEYLLSRKKPKHPLDISDWGWISLEMMPDYRVLSHKTEKSSKVLCKTHITVNSVVAMTHLCINGLGLATPPASMVEMELSNGLLVEPLSDWSTEPIPYYALWPNNITPNINAKHFLKFIEQSNTN